ncbi:hypothetical protein C8R43DRAFT_876624 [Mycena crocata]|nr:hypothetical protein C8R43DRAFT_876624 [Mycena crocata]
MAGATGSILLEPASLYVTTTQLAEARFHWALIATDTNCSAVRHHWHEKADTPGSAEGYGFQRVQPKSLTGRVVLGYFKISGYVCAPSGIFSDICETTFPTSYSTVPENRQNGITCRTWVLEVCVCRLHRRALHRILSNSCFLFRCSPHYVRADI